ncbi:hypothetical protein AcW2_000229 [Taiwanofungus camphoratus]|nr:hypothetical protein AcW2_000215 [Antrodia cinnamomea]KAI0931307.1 hypothetical protein AcW2_000229 [Antrodia cinnamomea]
MTNWARARPRTTTVRHHLLVVPLRAFVPAPPAEPLTRRARSLERSVQRRANQDELVRTYVRTCRLGAQ